MLNVDVALNNTNDQYQVTVRNLHSSAYLGYCLEIPMEIHINAIDTEEDHHGLKFRSFMLGCLIFLEVLDFKKNV